MALILLNVINKLSRRADATLPHEILKECNNPFLKLWKCNRCVPDKNGIFLSYRLDFYQCTYIILKKNEAPIESEIL